MTNPSASTPDPSRSQATSTPDQAPTNTTHTANQTDSATQDPAETWYKEEDLTPSRPKFWFAQLCLLLLALSIGLYPYLKKQFPGIERFFQPASYHQHQGHRHFQNRYYRQAIEDYHKALELGGIWGGLRGMERIATYYQIAQSHAYLHQYSRAIHYAIQAQRLRPDWLPAYGLVVELYTQLQRQDQFARMTKILSVRFPDNWQAWLMQGNGYLHFKQEKKAIQAYQQAIRSLDQQMRNITPEASSYTTLAKKKTELLSQLQHLLLEQTRVAQQDRIQPREISPDPSVAQRDGPPTPHRAVSRPTSLPTQQPSHATTAPTKASTLAASPKTPAASGTPQEFLSPATSLRWPTPTSLPVPRHRTHQRSQQLLLPPFSLPTEPSPAKKSP